MEDFKTVTHFFKGEKVWFEIHGIIEMDNQFRLVKAKPFTMFSSKEGNIKSPIFGTNGKLKRFTIINTETVVQVSSEYPFWEYLISWR